jgi:Caspase domain
MPIPTVGKTVAIILGASEFPSYDTLDPSPSFLKSAEDFRKYLCSYHGLRLPEENIAWLFNKRLQPGVIAAEVRRFIQERFKALSDVTDVIFYYCGHGGYLNEKEYFLALDITDKDSKEPTVFKISYLRDIVADLTKSKRNLIILDACYSGGALGEFSIMSDGNAAQLVTSQLLGKSSMTTATSREIETEMASHGIVLFCAAGAKKWAKTPLEGNYTMFTGSLLQVLDNGDQRGGPFFTLSKMAELVSHGIRDAFGSNAVQIQIHVPVQTEHDILQSPYFPNPAFDISDFESRLTDVASGVQALKAEFARFQSNFTANLNDRVRQAITSAGIDVHNVVTDSGSGPGDAYLSLLWAFLWAFLICVAIDGFSFSILQMILLTEFRTEFRTELQATAPAVAVAYNRLAVVLGAIMVLHLAIVIVSAKIRLTISRFPNELQRPFSWAGAFFSARVNYNLILWNSVVVLVILGFAAIIGHDVLRDFLISAQSSAPGPSPR